ncbi:Pre-mRNA-splicing factor cef1 [Cryoendolithus antarcticus]|uniref:Pre-mRNA-splicing factor cef1 n=1 Tax=Cryoendolithus antarcticus TaxID=1507870 RepID=A0A1V8TE93_9PEZI|nr:Pre-mRNA-splicing factor cef1 [Cryoendolithus antarcticus]
MPVVKGGVWTNIEDEILKAAISKYGLNQWARVSSLLARKTAKQCKARWTEWLDPGIRKIEWSREEDEKLLHLAKLMPTQWRTIAPIVGRTATQCLERYQKLLDEAEAREGEEMGLGGPEGGESAAPSADDVRRLRPGELDPEPESRPARPDTADMDEDEKEMLSEARARLANTQGKKAKRKARERQLEESKRMAQLQKRRELKAAGINIKVTTRKKGQMDYNADIPFEKAPAPGFYDTQKEMAENERSREMFDPRKQQLANKRKGDAAEVEGQEPKRRKNEKDGGTAAYAAAAKAGQLQRIREAEQSSKRRALNLPAPQVSEHELEDIVKMGLSGDRASALGDNDTTRGLVGSYGNVIGATPMRTPQAPVEEDRIANELRNARARTETQSVLFGGENTPLHEGGATTGYEGVAPSKQMSSTPNPLATPLRQLNGATPIRNGPSQTPARDGFNLNNATPSTALVSQTPRDLRLAERASKSSLRGALASLPRPQEMAFELELPDEQPELSAEEAAAMAAEDAALRDRRAQQAADDAARADLARQTKVVQRGLPRPSTVDFASLMKSAKAIEDPVERLIAQESARLIAADAVKFGGARIANPSAIPAVEPLDEETADRARMEVILEMGQDADRAQFGQAFEREWVAARANKLLPGYPDEDEEDSTADLSTAFDRTQGDINTSATRSSALESKLRKIHGGYIDRAGKLRAKIGEAALALEGLKVQGETLRGVDSVEQAVLVDRLEGLREEVTFIKKREREAQEEYRVRREELAGLES